MSLTLGLTGMDPATEAALKAAFQEANARLGGHWSLVPDAEAGHVVVDMDIMYGPMSWLRLHAAGRHVIGLTSAPRTQTDFRLGRPFDVEQLMQLLAESHERVLGTPAAWLASTATTDARVFNLYGATPATCYGPEANDIHGIDEWVSIDSMMEVTQVLALFIARWCGVNER